MKTFADQAVIAIENVRLFQSSSAQREYRGARAADGHERDPAGHLELADRCAAGVRHDRRKRDARVCDGAYGAVDVRRRRCFDAIATRGVPEAFGALPLRRSTGRTGPAARLDRRRACPWHRRRRDVEVPGDVARRAMAGWRESDASWRADAARGRSRSGPSSSAAARSGRSSDKQIALLKTFADQAVIAIENVRLFQELRGAQSRAHRGAGAADGDEPRSCGSSPLADRRPAGVRHHRRERRRLCERTIHHRLPVRRRAGSRRSRITASRPSATEPCRRMYPMRPSREQRDRPRDPRAHGRPHSDVLDDPEYERPRRSRRPSAIAQRPRRAAAARRAAIGAIARRRATDRALLRQQIALLKTFADQAVIAIENVRLFKELEARNRDLTEALEQQTATSEILRVICELADRRPAGLRHDRAERRVAVRRRCSARYTASTASWCTSPPITTARPRSSTRSSARSRCHPIAGSMSGAGDPDEVRRPCRGSAGRSRLRAADRGAAGGFRGVLAVPLLREGSRSAPSWSSARSRGRSPTAQIELLKTFADQAVIAIENVRLFTELEARNRDLTEALEQQTATSEILRVISARRPTSSRCSTPSCESAVRLCDGLYGAVYMFDGEMIRYPWPQTMATRRKRWLAVKRMYPRGRAASADRARRPRAERSSQIPDVLEDSEYAPDIALAARLP